MKKFIYLLLILPTLIFTSCSNDDDLPQVSFDVAFSGATNVDGTFYVVADSTFSIDAITVTPVDGTKEAAIGAVTYFWDYMAFGGNLTPPFGVSINTGDVGPGNHVLQFEASILQVGKSIAVAYFTYPIKIVASETEIPSGDKVSRGSVPANPTIRSGTGAHFD